MIFLLLLILMYVMYMRAFVVVDSCGEWWMPSVPPPSIISSPNPPQSPHPHHPPNQHHSCLDSLGRVVQKNVPEFLGPHFGAKLADANPRNFDAATLKQAGACVNRLNMGSALTMERRGFDISNSVTFGNQYVGASKTDAPTFLTTGDATVQNALGIDACAGTSFKEGEEGGAPSS